MMMMMKMRMVMGIPMLLLLPRLLASSPPPPPPPPRIAGLSRRRPAQKIGVYSVCHKESRSDHSYLLKHSWERSLYVMQPPPPTQQGSSRTSGDGSSPQLPSMHRNGQVTCNVWELQGGSQAAGPGLWHLAPRSNLQLVRLQRVPFGRSGSPPRTTSGLMAKAQVPVLLLTLEGCSGL
ncbi:uncharacterized protein [Struthio camelus]|uniref:uncharacterized protein isoform X3 n=1 Tax=Struthio camelus TaxID=8801 RepID=UPI003603BFC3